MRKRLTVLAMIALMAVPTYAATYSDRFVTFEYDDTAPSIIYCCGYSFSGFVIHVETAEYIDEDAIASRIDITVQDGADMPVADDVEIVSEDPLTVTWTYADNNGLEHTGLRKLLTKTDDRVAYVTLWGIENNKGYDFCKQIYDNVQIDPSVPLDCRYILIHNSLPFSPEIIPYLEQGIKLIDKALDGGDADVLAKDAESLTDSVKAIAERSGLIFDYNVLLFMPNHFDFDSSGALIDAKFTAQEVIDALTK